MNAQLIVVGKTDMPEICRLVDMYSARVNFHLKFSLTVIPDIRNNRNMTQKQQKHAEGEEILKCLQTSDRVILLDENGREFSSEDFAAHLQRHMSSGLKRLCFVIGGPYGFSEEVYARADEKISLSRMTFSHQMVRAIFTEQLYRACSIIAGEPYHHK